MPLLADRVKQTTTTTGTGTLVLDGTVAGFQTFDDGIGAGNQCYYIITDVNIAGGGYEVGIGTVLAGSPAQLQRDTVLLSSNAGAKVSWGAGAKEVFVDFIASQQIFIWSGGLAGGQKIIGGTAAGEKLTLESTSHATKGVIEILDHVALPDGKELRFGAITDVLMKWDDPAQAFKFTAAGNKDFSFGGSKIIADRLAATGAGLQANSIFPNSGTSMVLGKGSDIFVQPKNTANSESVNFKAESELVSVPNAVGSVDTTITIPANSVVIGVAIRVLVKPGGTANVDTGTAALATRFATDVSTVAGTTDRGLDDSFKTVNAAAEAIRLTFDVATTDALGSIRVTILYVDITPPTS